MIWSQSYLNRGHGSYRYFYVNRRTAYADTSHVYSVLLHGLLCYSRVSGGCPRSRVARQQSEVRINDVAECRAKSLTPEGIQLLNYRIFNLSDARD